jgi:hypothetical protein
MTTDQLIAFGGVIVTSLVGIISWIVSARLTKKGLSKRTLQYHMTMEPIMLGNVLSEKDGLKIEYKGE